MEVPNNIYIYFKESNNFDRQNYKIQLNTNCFIYIDLTKGYRLFKHPYPLFTWSRLFKIVKYQFTIIKSIGYSDTNKVLFMFDKDKYKNPEYTLLWKITDSETKKKIMEDFIEHASLYKYDRSLVKIFPYFPKMIDFIQRKLGLEKNPDKSLYMK